ncbi:efflux RND transporter periplasmic adaptor subunit [Enterobacter hormaechei subsp. xiangfangensis]|nr:efflux RND transporter periplasmic adaptor subunit [Enterobacter hormaechei subsp. xiangfangensis]MCE1390637.1 efflux RND transporter periplasmic adaptor subunit [Enterobacter hormaechei]
MKFPLLFALLACTLQPAFAAVIPVRVATVEQTAHAAERQIPGRIEAIHTVELRARTEGVITRIHFRDGQYVKKGDVLFELDDAEPRAVASAALEQAKARLETRSVTLNYTRITSPIDGRVGHSNFHVGSLVNPASGVLVEVVQLDPIRIAFALEEGAFATKAGQHADISAMKQAWQALIDSNGQRISGELTSVDNRIDPRTASVMLRAEFANPRHQLLPGGNVNVYLRPASELPVLTLPAAAVQQNGDGFFAWVINAEDKAEMRPLKVAGQIGQQFQIASGVKPGERAITDGAQRVQPGVAVQILN